MHARHIVVAVLAAAVTLTSVASAGPTAAKQRVAINTTILPGGTFVLTPRAGALKRDSGAVDEGKTISERNRVTTGLWMFTGKRGDLVFRERREWVDLGSDVNRDGFRDVVALGTWKAVRGTGQYAGVAGGGRSAHLGLGSRWVARFEGFLTSP